MHFARRLVELRKVAGLSKYRLAELTGITRQALSLLETGQREPNWDTVQRLAKALGVDSTAFEDPDLQLPDVKPPGKAGRPKKDAGAAPSGEKKRKGKGK
jgi:transcriptional regulator with XRE-family HTH domain